MDLFKKKLSEYIYITNRPAEEEIKAYCLNRQREFDLQDRRDEDKMLRKKWQKIPQLQQADIKNEAL